MNMEKLTNVVEFETGHYGIEILRSEYDAFSVNKYSVKVFYKHNGNVYKVQFTPEEFYNMTNINIKSIYTYEFNKAG